MTAGLVSTSELRAAGAGRADIRRALETGSLRRVRRGWYAVPATRRELVVAGQVGGRLSCVSALRLLGAWTLGTNGVHVRVSSGVKVARRADAILHWTAARVSPGLDDVEDALMTTVACADFRTLVVVIDSLVNRGILSYARLSAVLRITARGRKALAACDPRAESGIETIVRLALRRLGIRLRTQVVITGIGRVDILIGDRLVVEADGYEWHAHPRAFERDRARDRELVRRGYLVVRVSYRQALDDIDAVILAIRDVIARRDHLWRAVHRTQRSRLVAGVERSSTDSPDPES